MAGGFFTTVDPLKQVSQEKKNAYQIKNGG